MSERAPSFEQRNLEPDKHESSSEVLQPEIEKSKVEAKTIDANEARKNVDKARKQELETLDESTRSASRIIQVPLQTIQPVVETVAKTWTSIRQNLSPTQKRYSKIIHNPVVANISEFTAKTLARPYGILAGGLTAVIGSGVYLYYTRHLGYHYNYFVPILLFVVGLLVGTIVELSYKLLFARTKK